MKTKTTIKDIAREAGVSVATVSYVLNNKTEERISEETRKKVLQIVNLLDYTPNQSAKALATNRSRNIAVYLPDDVPVLKRAEQLYFVKRLSEAFKAHEYQIIHLSPTGTAPLDNADAIVCYDVPEREFALLGDRNFIPLLAFDSRIDDPLFFQVLSDYARIKEQAASFFAGGDYTFVSLPAGNTKLAAYLSDLFPSRREVSSLNDLTSLRGMRILTMEDTLCRLLSEDCELLYCPSVTEEKLEKLYECMEFAVSRVQIVNHNVIV